MGRVELVPAHEEPAFGLSPVPEEPELTDRAQRLRSTADQLDGLLRLADEELGMIVKLDALDPAPKVEAAALREELDTKLPRSGPPRVASTSFAMRHATSTVTPGRSNGSSRSCPSSPSWIVPTWPCSASTPRCSCWRP